MDNSWGTTPKVALVLNSHAHTTYMHMHTLRYPITHRQQHIMNVCKILFVDDCCSSLKMAQTLRVLSFTWKLRICWSRSFIWWHRWFTTESRRDNLPKRQPMVSSMTSRLSPSSGNAWENKFLFLSISSDISLMSLARAWGWWKQSFTSSLGPLSIKSSSPRNLPLRKSYTRCNWISFRNFYRLQGNSSCRDFFLGALYH